MNATMKPRAWLCELAEEDGTTRTQFVEEDPAGLRWNDSGEPSPYRTTPLLTMEQAAQMVAAERERCATMCENAAARFTAEGMPISGPFFNLAKQMRGPNVELTGLRRKEDR